MRVPPGGRRRPSIWGEAAARVCWGRTGRDRTDAAPPLAVGQHRLIGGQTGRVATRVVAHVRPAARVDVEMDIVLHRGRDGAPQGTTDGGCDSGSHAVSLYSLDVREPYALAQARLERILHTSCLPSVSTRERRPSIPRLSPTELGGGRGVSVREGAAARRPVSGWSPAQRERTGPGARDLPDPRPPGVRAA